MAASVAPTSKSTKQTTAATEASTTTSSTSSSTSTASLFRTEKIQSKDSSSKGTNSNSDNTQQTILNSHELCRSCGKQSDDLYELYHTHNVAPLTPMENTTAAAAASSASQATVEQTMPSPFTTSSTTCYGKSADSNTKSASCLAATATSAATSCSTAKTATTAAATTFDSVAATAKATAKGQSNMENILQEMQIWHLQIKCNDGLPQRICAKCTAQFYMIHKFRRKCLKVQAQLRGLYEEHHQQQRQPQQEGEDFKPRLNDGEPLEPETRTKEGDVVTTVVKEENKSTPTSTPLSCEKHLNAETSIEEEVRVNSTSTSSTPVCREEVMTEVTSSVAQEQTNSKPKSSTPTILSRDEKLDVAPNLEEKEEPGDSKDKLSTPTLDHESIHDECGLQLQVAASNSSDLPTGESSNTPENVNEATTSSASTNLVDNIAEAMDVDNATDKISSHESTEAIAATTSDIIVPASTIEETKIECSKREPCANDTIQAVAKRKFGDKDHVHHHGRSKSIDNGGGYNDNEADKHNGTQLADSEIEIDDSPKEKRKKFRSRKSEMAIRSRSSPECSALLLTKAALKSYSTITTRASAYERGAMRRQQLVKSLKEQASGKYQKIAGPQQKQRPTIKASNQTSIPTAALATDCFSKQLVLTSSCGLTAATGKKRNDDNNNDDRQHQQQSEEFTPGNFSKYSSASSKNKSNKMPRTEAKEAYNSKRRTEQSQKQMDESPELEQHGYDDVEQQPPARQRRKCSMSKYRKQVAEDPHPHPHPRPRPHDHHRRHKLSKTSTMKRALCFSADSTDNKVDRRRRRGRRSRQEADVRTRSTLEQRQQQSADEKISQHKSKKQKRSSAFVYKHETLFTSPKASGVSASFKNALEMSNTNSLATSKANRFTAKAMFNNLKGDPTALSPMSSFALSSSIYSSVQATTVTSPAAPSAVKASTEDYKAMLAYNADDIKWQRRRSQRLSTSSSSSLSSLSSSSLSSSYDDDDDDDFVDNNDDDEVYYEANTYRQLQDLRSSMILSQHTNTIIPGIYFWKTKAEMKENSNDVSMDSIKQTTTQEATIEEANTSTCSITEGLRSQTLNDDEKEPSIQSHVVTRVDEIGDHDDDAQQADDEDEDANETRISAKVAKQSEPPEEADQKQIKLEQHSSDDRYDADSAVQCSEAEISYNYQKINSENVGADVKDDSKQKPANCNQPTKTNDAHSTSTTFTPSDTKSIAFSGGKSTGDNRRNRGGMKLILQRRSSTRFTCLRQDDILDDQVAASSNSFSSASPVRKKKRKQRKAEKLLPNVNVVEGKRTFGQMAEMHDLDNTRLFQDIKRLKEDPEDKELDLKQEESQHLIQPESDKTNSKICPEEALHSSSDPRAEDDKTKDFKDSITEKVNDHDNVPTEKDAASCQQEAETNSQRLVIRVPLASLTQHFKRLHLTKDNEGERTTNEDDVKENHAKRNLQKTESLSEAPATDSVINAKHDIEDPITTASCADEGNGERSTSSKAPAPDDGKNAIFANSTSKEGIECVGDKEVPSESTSDKISLPVPSNNGPLGSSNNHSKTATSADDVNAGNKSYVQTSDTIPAKDYVANGSKFFESTNEVMKMNKNLPSVPSHEGNEKNDNEDLDQNRTLTSTTSECSPTPDDSLEISSLHPDLLEFVQETESVGAAEEITSSKPFCGASSKITDFINDFQNNCINSPDVDRDPNSMDVLPPLSSNPNLSAEIRDVEDTLNGILSEMHDRDMYTPRSGETEDFLAHSSIYSPMTDAPTTPSQSLYAESPCTVNSNPMSLSPFIQSHMDYNAMTPQSNHSGSMGGHTTVTMSSNSSHHGGGGGVSSDHFPSYTECFAEESTQSELIGFQNDIPCFENIVLPPNDEHIVLPPENANDDQEAALAASAQYSNKDLLDSLDKADGLKENLTEIPADDLIPVIEPQLVEIAAVSDNSTATMEVIETSVPYTAEETTSNLIQSDSSSSGHRRQASCDAITPSEATATHQQYVLTNTSHGPVLISAGQEHPQTQPQPQPNVQYVTLDPGNSASKLGWSNQNPPTPAAATYYVNTSGELFVSNPAFNTLIVPPQSTTTSQPSPLDTNENYLVYQDQHHQQPQPQPQQQQSPQQRHPQTNNASQYIMVVNNLNTGEQQYISNPTHGGAATVLLHTQIPNNNCNFLRSPSTSQEVALNAGGNVAQVPGTTTMPTFSIATNIPGQHATVSIGTVDDEAPPTLPKQEVSKTHIVQQKSAKVSIQPGAPRSRTQKINLVCRFCHKRPKFTNNVDYSNHIITMHPAEKPYNCDYCPKHFQRRSERQDHVALVHGSRYQCAQCGVSFCAQRALDFHLQKYHASTMTCSIPPRIATVAPTQQQQQQSSASSTPAVNHLQQNSTSSSSSASSPSASAYHLLHNAQHRRLVHAEDLLHAHNEDEEEGTRNNKRSCVDSQLDIMDETNTAIHRQQQHLQQPTRKLCCPDCDGDDDSCCSLKNNQPNNRKRLFTQQQRAGRNLNDGIGGNRQPPHITLPSPEQAEPDSTTTLRHFRKNPLKSPTAVSTNNNNFSCTAYSTCTYNSNSSNSSNNNNSHYDSSSSLSCSGVGGRSGPGYYGKEKYVSTRDLYNCHLCEDAFPTATALRRHRNVAHNNHSTMPFICTICKRGFRLRNALQRHMETHDAEGRPYECNICQVRFPRPSQLTLHKLTVHKFEKVHTCDECGKQFGTESSLKAHEKVAHEANSMPLPFACVYLEAPKSQKPKVTK